MWQSLLHQKKKAGTKQKEAKSNSANAANKETHCALHCGAHRATVGSVPPSVCNKRICMANLRIKLQAVYQLKAASMLQSHGFAVGY
jgi:hypothetical protein